MKIFLLSFLIIVILSSSISVDLDTYYKEYIYSFGYTLEENQVTTSDGYILSIWHLTPKNPNGKVEFL